MRTLPYSIALIVILLGAVPPVHAQSRDALREAYLAVYDGRPDDARVRFDQLRAGGESLAPWFGMLFATIYVLEHDESLTTDFERSLDRFLEVAERRHERSAGDSEASFYLAQGLLLRSTYRVSHDKGMWGAARDAARAKRLTEDYLEQHPEHGDAYVALGLYNYFVDIAPNYVKVLRVLLLLPSGNRAQGLDHLHRAIRDGDLLAPFAQTALSEILGSFEGRPHDAISLTDTFLQRFPRNADMRLSLASLLLDPRIEQFARAEREIRTVLANTTGTAAREVSHRHSAIAGLASVRRAQWRLDDAIELLDTAIAGNPTQPRWVMPALLLRRANYKMLINDPSATRDAERVLGDREMRRWHRGARQTLEAIESRRRNNEGPVYAALIPGNGLVAADRFEEAQRAYAEVATRHPGDWQVRYRLAYLDFARGQYSAAATALQTIVTAVAPMPDWVRANALLHLAYTHDLAGRRDEAIQLYRRIVDKFEDESAAGSARVGLVAPYQQRS